MSAIHVDKVAPAAGGTERNLSRGVSPAWVNFNGTGTVAIRSSAGVSSLTDAGVGNYQINVSVSMSTTGYVVGAQVSPNASSWDFCSAAAASVSRADVYATTSPAARSDMSVVMASVHGDLA